MEQYIGQILMVGFNFAPVGWALCNGQLLSIAQNTALFSLIGTFYGGDGVSNFALPNLQGRVPIHQGQGSGLSPYVIGQRAGTENVTLQTGNLPAHSHAANCNSGAGTNGNPTGNFWAGVAADRGTTNAFAAAANSQLSPTAIGMTGNNLPVPVIQPYLCVNFIIALVGIFPSRG